MPQPKVVVHGTFAAGGLPAVGECVFTTTDFAVDPIEGVVYAPESLIAYLDQNGEFFVGLPLLGTEALPSSRIYSVEVQVAGHSMAFTFQLNPSLFTVEFASLVPVIAPVLPPSGYVSSVVGLTGVVTYDALMDQLTALIPGTGASAYQVWLEGHTGSVDDFMAFLTGPHGPTGPAGATGAAGPTGLTGPRGPAGPIGKSFTIETSVANQAALTNLWPAHTLITTRDNGHLWSYSGSAWIDLGSIKGDPGAPGVVTFSPTLRADLSIDQVNNTSDLAKPISTATQAALNAIAATNVDSVNGDTGDVFVTKSSVGLANVDNTSDANKPLSAAALVANAAQNTALTNGLASKQALLPVVTGIKFLRNDLTFQPVDKTLVGLDLVPNQAPVTDIPTGTDLDSLTTPGTYFQHLTSGATLLLHYPMPRAGYLEVLSLPGSPNFLPVQRYTTYANPTDPYPRSWVRGFGSAVWLPWRPVSQQIASGTFLYTPSGADVTGTVDVNFPAAMFTAVPVIQLTPFSAVPHLISVGYSSPSTSGFTANLYRTTATAFTVNWLAIGI